MSIEIVAELGVNHLGDTDKLLALAAAAKSAGASSCKVQAYDADRLIARRGITDTETIDLLKRAELSDDQLDTLAQWCRDNEYRWFASVFQVEQVERVLSRGACALKIGHAEAQTYPALLGACFGAAEKHKIDVWISNPGTPKGYLHSRERPVLCISSYPADGREPALRFLGDGTYHGYSSHFTDYRIPAAAALRGAEYIEAHLMLGNRFPMTPKWDSKEPEAAWSLSPDDFAAMVRLIREYESWL